MNPKDDDTALRDLQASNSRRLAQWLDIGEGVLGVVVYTVYFIVLFKVAVGAWWVGVVLSPGSSDTAVIIFPVLFAIFVTGGLHWVVRRWWRKMAREGEAKYTNGPNTQGGAPPS